jgi:putative Holliday junction resolvase
MSRPSRRVRRNRPGRKLLGLDLGERRIGVAVSDAGGTLASPLETVDLKHTSLAAVAELARRHQVEGIVAGLPTTLSGVEGHQAIEARRQAAELQALVTVPLVFWDERLTSAMADRILEESGRRTKRERGLRDAIAAAVMLQSFLDVHPLPALHRPHIDDSKHL